MTTQEQRRKAFEQHFAGRYPSTDPEKLFGRGGDLYWNPHIQSRWIGWNAALDSVEVALPAKLEAQPYACYESGWNDALLEAADAIEAAGVMVKQ